MGAEQSVGRRRGELEAECNTRNIAASNLCVTCGVQSESQLKVLSSLQPTAAIAESFIATINACGDICNCNCCYCCCCCRRQQCCYSQTVDISNSSRPQRERRQSAAAAVSKQSSDEMHQLVQGEAADAHQQQPADTLQSSTATILDEEEQTQERADKQCDKDDCAQLRARNQRKQQQQQLHNINNEPTNRLKSQRACKTLKATSNAATCLARVFPILSSFGGYKLPADLITDLTAGFTMGIIQLPQGMAYATLAGVEPIVGLYVSFVPVLVMALMGTSHHVSYGTFAICSLLFSSACDSVRNTLEANGAQLITGGAANRALFAIAAAATNRSAQVGGDALVIVDNHRQKIDDLHAGQQQASILQRVQYRDQMQMRPLDDIGKLLATGAAAAAGDLSGATTTTPATMSTPAPFVIHELPSQLEILTTLCLLVGCVQLAMACVRLGLISLVFSDNLVAAFTSAAAMHVLSLQLDGLFDIPSLPSASLQQQQTSTFQAPPTAFKLFWLWRAFGARLATHANVPTALLTAVSLVYLYSARYLLEPALERRLKWRLSAFPVELALMAVVSVVTANFSLQDAPFNFKVVGQVPAGFPSVALPRVDFAPLMLQDAVKIAVITFALSVSFCSSVARSHRTKIAANRELAAMGSANIVGSLFGCFPIGISLSRTALQSRLNPKSQLCSVFSCALVLSVILYFASYLHSLPTSTLNCIIVVALRNVLLQVRDLPKVWRASRLDGIVWLLTYSAVVVFDIIEGMLIGVSISLAAVFFRLLTPNCSILGKLPNSDIFVELQQNDANCNNAAQELKAIKVIRLSAALCYLNCSMVKARISKILLTSNRPKKASAKTASLETIVIVSQQHPEEDEQQRQQKTANKLTDVDDCQGARDDNRQQHCNIKVLVVDCSALTYCDASGVSTLVGLIETLGERKNLTVYLAACRLRLVEMLKTLEDSQCGDGSDAVRLEILRNNIFLSVQTAVAQAEQRLMAMQDPNKIFQQQQDAVTDEPSPSHGKS